MSGYTIKYYKSYFATHFSFHSEISELEAINRIDDILAIEVICSEYHASVQVRDGQFTVNFLDAHKRIVRRYMLEPTEGKVFLGSANFNSYSEDEIVMTLDSKLDNRRFQFYLAKEGILYHDPRTTEMKVFKSTFSVDVDNLLFDRVDQLKVIPLLGWLWNTKSEEDIFGMITMINDNRDMH